jgi:beta-glucuronidase
MDNGGFDHHGLPKEQGFFVNQKPESPADLVEYDFDSDWQVKVPGDWNTQKEKLYYYEGLIWYQTTFDHACVSNEACTLYFEAVNYEATVYLNGTLLGSHTGGFTPFQFNVTGHLREGQNLLVVKVDNRRSKEAVPTLMSDWWNYGGITRSVRLVSTPMNHIFDYSVQLRKGSDRIIEGWVKVKNGEEGEGVTIRIPELGQELEIPLEQGVASFSIEAQPELWSPENPKRYAIDITTAADQVHDEIGFRTVETQGSRILLNGKPVFLKGISIHEEAPFKTGRVTSVEECRVLLNWAKELGCNFIRLAHYPHNEWMVREAERMGFLLWCEIPVYWTIAWENEPTYLNARNQLSEMITRDKNRAAVILWSVANETPEGASRLAFLKNLAEHARLLDDTRLLTAALDTQSARDGGLCIEDALGEVIDVIGINSYFGWYGGDAEDAPSVRWSSKFDKPMIMSEMGAGALYGKHGGIHERFTEEHQAHIYEMQLEMLRGIDFLAGLSPWILMDFRSARRHLRRIQADFNRKGLISDQGQKKQAFFVLQDFYREEEP